MLQIFFQLKALWGLDWSEVPPTSKSGNETRNPRNFEQKSPTLEPRDWKPQFGANRPNLGLLDNSVRLIRDFFEASTSGSSCSKSIKLLQVPCARKASFYFHCICLYKRMEDTVHWCYQMICFCHHLYCVEDNRARACTSCVHHNAACPPLAVEPCTFSGPGLAKKYSKDNRI